MYNSITLRQLVPTMMKIKWTKWKSLFIRIRSNTLNLKEPKQQVVRTVETSSKKGIGQNTNRNLDIYSVFINSESQYNLNWIVETTRYRPKVITCEEGIKGRKGNGLGSRQITSSSKPKTRKT